MLAGFYAGPTFDLIGTRYVDFANTYSVGSYGLLGARAGFSTGQLGGVRRRPQPAGQEVRRHRGREGPGQRRHGAAASRRAALGVRRRPLPVLSRSRAAPTGTIMPVGASTRRKQRMRLDGQNQMRLLRQARSGDLQAFEQLVRQHQAEIHDRALQLTGRHGEAFEATQDVFVQLHAAMARISSPSHLRHWLLRAVVQRAAGRAMPARR